MAKEPNTIEHPAATVTVPEQITIGENTFTVKDYPELEIFVQLVSQAAAQVEKGKLYNTIKSLQEENKTLGSEVTRLKVTPTVPAATPVIPGTTKATFPGTTSGKPAYQTAETERLKNQMKEENQQGVVLTPEAVAEMISTAFSEGVPKLFKQYMDPVVQKLEKAEQEKVNDYRVSRLTELGDTVVPELITGNTKEEIDASIVMAQQIRSRYATPVAPTVPVTPAIPAATTTIPVEQGVIPVSNPPQMVTPGAAPKESPRGMSDKEFAEKREGMLANLKGDVSAYPQITHGTQD